MTDHEPGLLEPVCAILDTLRDVTGRDVQFVRKRPDLPCRMRWPGAPRPPRAVSIATKTIPDHHVIANECAHLIRLFRTPV